MTFGNPPMLNLVPVTVLLLGLFFWWAWRKRQRDIAQFVRSRLLAHLTVGVSAARQKSRLVLLTLAVACLLVALARPQWGYDLEEVKQKGLDIVVALDTSRSMLAEDTSPNRLTRAKLAALELMPLARTDRLGLVAFAGTAFLQCPLTVDDDAFRQSVNVMNVGIIPQGGTAIAEALQTALTAFKNDEENEKVIVLITDGEDHEQGVEEAAEAAAKAGVHIFTIGVGTPQGELVRAKDENGKMDYVRDESGNVVKSHLDEDLLRKVARIGSGFYVQLRGANTMDLLYEKGLAPLLGQTHARLPNRAEKSAPRLVKRFFERFQWPLGIAILLLLTEMFIPDRKLARRPEQPVPHTIAWTRATVVLVLLLSLSSALGSPAKALQLYKEGKYQEAWQEYQRLMSKNPKDPRLAYNAGVSAYQAGEYEAAQQQFGESSTAPDLNLQERSFYNLGNTLYRLGDKAQELDKKREAWEQSALNYRNALKLDPKDTDAQYNSDFVQKQLEELKKLEQQQKQQQDQQKQNQNKKDDQNSQSKQDQSKQDKSKQDQSQQNQSKQDQSKQDQSKQKQDEQKKSPDQKQDQAHKPDQDKKKEENAAAAADKKKPEEEKPEQEQAASASVPEGQMTPQQARQLLDAQKNDEKALIFTPKDKPGSKSRIFKDW